MASSSEWTPKRMAARPADMTETIHRAIAWFYGAIGALVLAMAGIFAHREWALFAVLAGIFGTITGLHAALAAGARRRSGLAKAGSMVVGILMLIGFPLGTIIGGILIYNAAQNWPPRPEAGAGPAGPDMRLL